MLVQKIFHPNFYYFSRSERRVTIKDDSTTAISQEISVEQSSSNKEQGAIHILRKHIFGLFGTPPSLSKNIFSTENKQKLPLYNFPPPYKCLRNLWMVPKQKCSEKNWQRKALDWKRWWQKKANCKIELKVRFYSIDSQQIWRWWVEWVHQNNW